MSPKTKHIQQLKRSMSSYVNMIEQRATKPMRVFKPHLHKRHLQLLEVVASHKYDQDTKIKKLETFINTLQKLNTSMTPFI